MRGALEDRMAFATRARIMRPTGNSEESNYDFAGYKAKSMLD